MRQFGLIGNPLSHSWSATYFAGKFSREQITDCEYRLFPLKKIKDLTRLLEEHPNLEGLNVTIPFKTKVMALLDETDELSAKTGAVNCIRIIRLNNKIFLKGFNTDVEAFRQSLMNFAPGFTGNALLLGDGGAAKAVKYVLRSIGIKYLQVSRHPVQDMIAYSQITETTVREYPLIINATPCGMYPDVNSAPDLPYDSIDSSNLLFDLIYNPEETAFLKNGRLRGAKTRNGLEMLHLQAEASWKIWNRKDDRA